MLYFYSIVASITWPQLMQSMLYDVIMIATGFLGSYLPRPYSFPFIAVSCYCCWHVVIFIWNMIGRAIDEDQDARNRMGLLWAQRFFTSCWIGVAVVWFIGNAELVSVNVEETLTEILDFLTKAGASAILMYSSMQTHKQREAARHRAALEEEQARALTAAKESTKQRECFFKALSDELGAHITRIVSVSESLLKALDEDAPIASAREPVEYIKGAGTNLSFQIKDILTSCTTRIEPWMLKMQVLRMCVCVCV
jgi:hypothetical protein